MLWRRKGVRKRKPSADRPPHNWRVRGVIVAACAVLGYVGLTSSVANVAARADAATAYTLSPSNGTLAAAAAEQIFASRPDADAASQAARLAREALLQDGTAVEALTVLGFQAQLRGDDAASDRYFALGTRLSRRELRPQLWAIEEAVSQGDIAGALRKYDVALRTSAEAQDILFPILTNALAKAKVRRELLRIISTQPLWSEPFIGYAAAAGRDPVATARFFSEGRSIPLQVQDAQRVALINSLFNASNFAQAWSQYTALRGVASSSRSRDERFSLQADARTPFDWRTGDDVALSAAILQTDASGVLDFAVPPSVSGTIVSQIQMLAPGTYRLQGRSAGLEQPERSRPYWLLSCYGGQELSRLPVPNSSQRQGAFAGTFFVPTDCSVQTLSLIARATDDINGVTGQILEVRLWPAGRSGGS